MRPKSSKRLDTHETDVSTSKVFWIISKNRFVTIGLDIRGHFGILANVFSKTVERTGKRNPTTNKCTYVRSRCARPTTRRPFSLKNYPSRLDSVTSEESSASYPRMDEFIHRWTFFRGLCKLQCNYAFERNGGRNRGASHWLINDKQARGEAGGRERLKRIRRGRGHAYYRF